MGYYTRFEFSIKENPSNVEDSEIAQFIHKQRKTNKDFMHPVNIHLDGFDDIGDEYKWYEHEDEMKTLSKAFPDIVFQLSGKGEESGDIWANYYKDGKVQVCKVKMTIEDFDPSKFK